MAFTRFHDDADRQIKYLEESTFQGIYHLNTPGNGLKNPYVDDVHIRLQKLGANLHSHSCNIESNLSNMETLSKNACQKNCKRIMEPKAYG